MKKNLFSRIVVVMMAIVMLASSCLSVSALSVSAPNTATENDDYYSVSYKDGVLSIRVNPDKIHGILKDGDLTKEELLEFIPSDVLDTLAKGKEVTLDDLRELAANYITVDDLKAMVRDLPINIVRKYFSFDMLLDIFTIQEIVDLVPVEDILSAIDTDKFNELLTDEAIELALNENLENKVLTDEFIQNVIDNTSLVDDLMEDEAIKAQFVALVNDEVVNAIMKSEYGPKITEFAAKDTVVNRIMANESAVTILENYFTSQENDAAFNMFIKDKAVDEALVNIPEIKSYLLTEAVIHSLVEKKVITQTNFRQIFTDDDIAGFVTDDTLSSLMANEQFVNSIFTDNDIVTKVVTLDFALKMYNANLITVTSPDPDVIKAAVLASNDAKKMFAAEMRAKTTVADYWKHIKPTDFESLAFSLETAIKNELTTNTEAYSRIFDVVDPEKIVEAIGINNCRHLIHGHVADLVKQVGISKVFYYYGNGDVSKGQNNIVNALGGYSALVSNDFVTVDEIADLCAGYANLISFFDRDEIIDIVGVSRLAKYVDMADLVDAAGGYSNLLKLYTNEELKAIINAIGTDNIKTLVKECAPDITKAIDYKQVALDILDYAKSKWPDVKQLAKTIVSKTLTILLTEVEDISLNGETIYETGSFDLNKIIIQTLRAIPDVNAFLELGEDDIFAKYVVEIDIAGEHFAYGVELGFLGDPSNLQKLMQNYADNFQLDVSDNGDIDLQIAVPTVVTNLYAKALESDRIPDTLKEKLIMLPTLSIEDARAVIAGISKDEIATVVDALKDKLNEIKEKAYAEIDERFGVYNSKARLSPSDLQVKISNAKARVDEIIDSFASVDTAIKLQNKALALIDKIPENLSNAEILDFYNASGNFSASVGASVDFYELINRYISLPEEVKLMFNSTVLSYTLSTDFTVYNMYELELMLADGSTYKTLLPAGVSLDVLDTVDALGDVSSGFCFGDTTNTDVMPAFDVKLYSNDLYSVQFVANGNIVDTVFYVYGADSIAVPAIPEGYDRAGYVTKWEDFTLNTEKRLTVNLDYATINYFVVFMADNKQVGEPVRFTVETESITEPPVPEKLGYTGAWEEYELKIPAEGDKIYVNALYTAKTYYAVFMANGTQVGEPVQFTVETESITEPPVPEKLGYAGAWEEYELKIPAEGDTIYINATYTPVIYTATFVADGKEVAKIPFTVEDKSIAEPAVPAKEGYTGKWEAYTLGAADITVNAIYTAISPVDEGCSWLWWILIIIAIIIIALVIFFIIKSKKNDDDNTPPPATEPEPIVEPEPEPDPIVPVVVPEEVDDVTVEEVDELMTDDDALAAVVVVENDATEPSTGPKAIVNVGDINEHFSEGDTVNLETLIEKQLVPAKTGRLKVLASGHLNKHHLTVEANSFSVQAIKMIQLTGGTVIQKK